MVKVDVFVLTSYISYIYSRFILIYKSHLSKIDLEIERVHTIR